MGASFCFSLEKSRNLTTGIKISEKQFYNFRRKMKAKDSSNNVAESFDTFTSVSFKCNKSNYCSL